MTTSEGPNTLGETPGSPSTQSIRQRPLEFARGPIDGSAAVADESSRRPIAPAITPFRLRIVLGLVFLVFGAFYAWTATTGGQGLQFGGAQTDHYNQQTNGFLAGELSIPTLPPKGLLDLSNPYSPAQNAPYRESNGNEFLDLSLYHGHFYLAWGPTPVITLFLPWRILHIGGLPQNLAIFIYCAVGLAFALLLLELLVRRYLPGAKTWQVGLGAIALASSNVAPFLLRNVAVYEVAEACSYCFAMIGLYLFCRGGLAGRFNRWQLAVGSLSFGLAAGGHVDAIFLGVIPLALSIAVFVRMRTDRVLLRVRNILPILGPCVVVILGLLVFNEVRFGSFFQYGQSYQLTGSWDQLTQPVDQPGYLAPNLYYFLVAPPRFDLIFPYFSLPPPPNYPGVLPANYVGLELTAGVLSSTPIALALFALPRLIRRRFDREFSVALLLTALAGLLIVGFLSFAIAGVTMRYEANFASLFLMPAVVCWLALCQSRRAIALAAKILGTVAIVLGALVGIAISITGDSNQFQHAEPGQFAALRGATSPFATLITMIVGHPIVLDVNPWLTGASYGNVSYLELGEAESMALNLSTQPIDIQLVSPHGGTFGFDFDAVATSGAPKHRTGMRILVVHGESKRLEPFVAGPQTVKVPLNAGLNDVYLSIVPPKGVPDNGGNPIYTGTSFHVGAK